MWIPQSDLLVKPIARKCLVIGPKLGLSQIHHPYSQIIIIILLEEGDLGVEITQMDWGHIVLLVPSSLFLINCLFLIISFRKIYNQLTHNSLSSVRFKIVNKAQLRSTKKPHNHNEVIDKNTAKTSKTFRASLES